MTRDVNEITEKIIGCAIKVHRALGPGLLASAYEACLVYELMDAGFKVERQKPIPVRYREIELDCGYRLDLLVEELVIVELKAVDSLNSIPEAQMMSYLKLSGLTVGLLVNFNVERLTKGLRRIVMNHRDNPSQNSASSAVHSSLEC